MDLTPKQQASEAIRQAESILIVTGQRPNVDQTASVAALAMILRKLGKKVTALITDQTPSSIQFITQGQIDRSLTGLRDFIVKVDLSRAEVDKLKYTIEDGKLNIHVIPFKGGFSQNDVTFSHGDFRYDLIIALGVPTRAKLDNFFTNNPGLLASTPLLNMDFHRINENYGAINLIDMNSATLAEMLVSLAESLQSGLLDEPIATALLAGIMASTDRFTAPHTTPKAMTVAAQLMAAGGKQQQIVRAIFAAPVTDRKPYPKPPVRPQAQTPAPVAPVVAPQPAPAPMVAPVPEPVVAPNPVPPASVPTPAEEPQNPLEYPQTPAAPQIAPVNTPEPDFVSQSQAEATAVALHPSHA